MLYLITHEQMLVQITGDTKKIAKIWENNKKKEETDERTLSRGFYGE